MGIGLIVWFKNMKDQIKKWTSANWVLTIVLVIVVIYLFLWVFQKGEFDNFSYPFNADVFGTVSDWAMVLVTAVTAHYLWKTLKSQTKVQEMQQGLFDIEEYKFFQSIKPDFPYVFKWKHRQNQTGNKDLLVDLTVACDNHKALEVEISTSINFQNDDMIHLPVYTEAEIEKGEVYPILEREQYAIPRNGRFYLSIQVIIHYYDVNKNNKYQKYITIDNSFSNSFSFRQSDNPPIHIWTKPKDGQ